MLERVVLEQAANAADGDTNGVVVPPMEVQRGQLSPEEIRELCVGQNLEAINAFVAASKPGDAVQLSLMRSIPEHDYWGRLMHVQGLPDHPNRAMLDELYRQAGVPRGLARLVTIGPSASDVMSTITTCREVPLGIMASHQLHGLTITEVHVGYAIPGSPGRNGDRTRPQPVTSSDVWLTHGSYIDEHLLLPAPTHPAQPPS